jgi:hypothetical protein
MGVSLPISGFSPRHMASRRARVLTRVSLALLCAVSLISPLRPVYAQESGLRGTTDESSVESKQNGQKKPKVKNGVKKSRLATQEAVQVIERYQPADIDSLDQNTSASNTNDVDANSSIENGQATPQISEVTAEPLEQDATSRAASASRLAGRSLSIDPEIPEPFTRQASDGSLASEDFGRVERENDRTGSIEGKVIAAEDNPFAAPGIRAGTFVLRPTFEAGLRYSNNPNDPTCDCFANRAESKLLLRAESDWLRHALNFEADVSLKKALSNKTGLSNIETLEKGLRLAIDGRLDATAVDQITVSASFDHAREVLDTSSIASFAERPMVNNIRGSIGYTHDAGIIGLGGSLSLARQTYGNGIDLAGATITQDDRDNTNITGTLRASYELSPVFSPFLEAEIGRRQFDNELDAAGVANSATRYALRAGSEINFGEKLNGELAGGWFVENIDDASLRNVSGFDIRGTMNWSPVRGTNIALNLGTQVDGARSATSSTSVLYTSSAAFTRRIRSNLDANALLSASFRDFQGSEATQTNLSAEIGATWWFNRFSGIKGSVQHSATLSPDPARKRSSTGVYLGVVLRR